MVGTVGVTGWIDVIMAAASILGYFLYLSGSFGGNPFTNQQEMSGELAW